LSAFSSSVAQLYIHLPLINRDNVHCSQHVPSTLHALSGPPSSLTTAVVCFCVRGL